MDLVFWGLSGRVSSEVSSDVCSGEGSQIQGGQSGRVSSEVLSCVWLRVRICGAGCRPMCRLMCVWVRLANIVGFVFGLSGKGRKIDDTFPCYLRSMHV